MPICLGMIFFIPVTKIRQMRVSNDQAKYKDKLLVGVAISHSGISNCYIVPSKMVVNQKVYLEECLIKQLLSFTKKHHSIIGMYFGKT